MSDYGTTKQEQQSVWKVLTRKSAASYMKEETVKVPVYYRMIGVEAFKSTIKMDTLMLPNGMLEIGADGTCYGGQQPHPFPASPVGAAVVAT